MRRCYQPKTKNMSSIKTLAVAITGLSVFSAAHGQSYQNNHYSKSQIGMALMRANTVSLDHGKSNTATTASGHTCAAISAWPKSIPELVRRHESKYASSAAYFNRTIERSRPLYVPHQPRSGQTQHAGRNRPAALYRKRVRYQSQIRRRRVRPVAVHARHRPPLRPRTNPALRRPPRRFTPPPTRL